MATPLTNIFGDEISVSPQANRIQRTFHGFTGANGITSMHHGSRGRTVIVSGRLRASGNNYQAARENLEDIVSDIEQYRSIDRNAADYSFMGTTYENCLFNRLTLIPSGKHGKIFHYNSEGQVYADFAIEMIELT